MSQLKKEVVLIYLIWPLIGLCFYLLFKILPGIGSNLIYFSAFVVFVLLLPGWLISQILNFIYRDFSHFWLRNLILSLGFYFLINLLGIFLGTDIDLLLRIDLILVFLLWLLSFNKELFWPKKKIISHYHFKEIIRQENIFYILPLLIGFFVLWVLEGKGADFNGDPYFHLAIMRKAIDGSSLSIDSLSFTKTALSNPAYILPVWHILLASISKILAVDIFLSWQNIIFTLFAISFMAMFLLVKTIFKDKIWAIIAVLLFVVFSFYSGPGYFFTRLAVPDTLTQFVLLPLALAFVFDAIFINEKNKNEKKWQTLVIAAISAILLLFVHAPHYFYLVLAVVLFAILHLVFHSQDKDYWQFARKIFLVLTIILIPLLVLTILIEIAFGSVVQALQQFMNSPTLNIAYSQFDKFPITYQYGYFLLPFVFLFLKNKRILTILALMLLVPIVYLTPLKDILSRYLSVIFTDRLLINTSMYFLVFTLILGSILKILDLFVYPLSVKVKKYLSGILGILFVLIIFIGLKTNIFAELTYNIFYSKLTYKAISDYTLLIFIITIILALLSWVIYQKKEFFQISPYKNILAIFFLTALFIFILISPSIENARKFVNNSTNQKNLSNFFTRDFRKADEMIEFVNQKIPSKSVFLATPHLTKTLAVTTDQYMAYNVGSAWDKKLNLIFNPSFSNPVKDELITSPKYEIDYVLLESAKAKDRGYFENNALFYKIYDNNFQIYKVVK